MLVFKNLKRGNFMKKLLSAILVVLILSASLVVSVSAAGDINSAEKAILDLLDKHVVAGESHVEIPPEYLNQAKAYFMTVDITEEQSKEVIANLNDGIELATKALNDAKKDGKTITNLKQLPQDIREAILEDGQKACAAVELNLTYVPSKHNVLIKEQATGKTVFEDTAAIKVTGANYAPLAVVLGVLALTVSAAFVLRKREA